ncbi:TonB-dependent receptor [Telmatospirillum siberiense]|uniref:TonB-dependent receptor n=1 Tax=Telmatospirillum siberiense TaxID=382514 RepID=UPI0013042517|nr:TonB-dependent receptor [Telmatospirillum siberiense]
MAIVIAFIFINGSNAFSQQAPSLTDTPSSSQNATSDAIEDVVVTAERRETKLQTTPGSIAVIDQTRLQDAQINTLRDAKGLIPNVNIPGTFLTNSTQSYWFRGIGENDPYQDPAVGYYVDDVVSPRLIGSLGDLADAERVEVLVGPQGTLYGRNTNGGAVKVITKTPGDKAEVFGDIGGGDWGQFESHGYAGGAIVPGKAYASLSFSHAQNDGFSYNEVLRKDVMNKDVTSLRGKFRLTPSDDLDIRLSIDGGRDNSPSFFRTPVNRVGGYDPGLIDSERNPQGKLELGGTSLNITKDLNDAVTLKSITAARGFTESPIITDSDGLPSIINESSDKLFEKFYSQEFQAAANYDALNLVGGLFLYHEFYSTDRTVFASNVLEAGRLTTDSGALFGQGTYKITDQLSGIFGLRLTDEKRQNRYRVDTITATGTPTATRFNSSAAHTWYSLAPKAGVDYQWTPSVFQYATVTKGFKSGGYDRAVTTVLAATTAFAPEKVVTYETGVKTSWLDRRATANLALFYNDYKDLQLSIWNAAVNTYVRSNAEKAHSQGAELSTTLLLAKGLEWLNSAGFLIGKYDEAVGALGAGTNAKGNRLMNAPHWTLDSGLDYTLPLAIPGKLKTRADIKYQTSSFSNVANTPQVSIPSYAIVDLGISYTTEDNHWTLSGTAKNIFDQRPLQIGNYSPPGIWVATPYPPTTVFFKLAYHL